MENLRQQFLLEAVETLKNLAKDLQTAETVSDSVKRHAFRTLHTVKGTAQTFGFPDASRLAHELENLLGGKNSNDLFLEGIELLIKSLTEKDFEFPKQFAEKVRVVAPNASEMLSDSDNYLSEIPSELFSQLSNQEKNVLHSTLRDGKKLFGLEIGFELANFADELISFRELLSESGEIIATFPSTKFNADGKIGFQFLLASSAAQIEKSGADLIFQFSPDSFTNDAPGAIARVVKHGKAIAEKLNKKIEFKTEIDDVNLSPQKLKLVFDVLLHLVRNAVDHAIESAGEIKIHLKVEENVIRLTVADNGRGIDLEKIKAAAVGKNLIFADEILTEQETIDLIFLPEFSTKSDVTEISGRGIGLDAVKFAVEKADGKITVESRSGRGTTFEVFLPH